MADIKLADLLSRLYSQLPNARHEVDWLVSHYLNLRKSELPLHRADIISEENIDRIYQAITRRKNGEPLQYITGLQPFWDFELIVTPAVLIPRWDSEPVIEQALSLLPKDKPCLVADICTGSGAYAVTLKHERPNATVIGCDISAEALLIARLNAEKYHLDIEFRQGDLTAALPDGEFELIVSNPPYIRTDEILPADVLQEPHLALFGGKDGLDFYRRLAKETLPHLKQGGYLLLEIGCEQAAAVEQLLTDEGFVNCRHGQDLAGLDRWVQAEKA